MSTTPPELSRIKSVPVPRRMYVSKFQRYGGAAIVVVLAVAVGAGMLPGSIDRQASLEEKRRLERDRLERGSDERASRPPVHEAARRRHRGIKLVGDGSVRYTSQFAEGVPPRGGFAFLNASGRKTLAKRVPEQSCRQTVVAPQPPSQVSEVTCCR